MMLNAANRKMIALWQKAGTRFMPFADAASDDVPLSRLLRLALFQVSAGCVLVLLTGTLNRVLIVELGVSVALVSAVVAIPVLAARYAFSSATGRTPTSPCSAGGGFPISGSAASCSSVAWPSCRLCSCSCTLKPMVPPGLARPVRH